MLSFEAKDKKNTYPPTEDISSPKEAFRTAEAAVLGASAMFKTSFWGDFGCCQVLPSRKPVFIRVSRFSMVLHNVCFSSPNACIFRRSWY